ncbi:MAG: VWA domain-containing protein, partial [Candidatus Sumerlaeota bacterium]|nr:VWA domain-containing protein [Candidatus Sumerlaeota bacterium]
PDCAFLYLLKVDGLEDALAVKFLVPWAFGAFATLPVIVVFYLLKLRRDEWLAPSTLLWRKSVDNLQANSPFQKLRANLLLLLQLLLAAALAFALTRPLMNLASQQGASRILLMDVSASMAAKDGPGGSMRMDAAKALAFKEISGMLPGDEMMLVAFANSAEAPSPFTRDRSQLNSLVSRLEARALPTDVTEALSLAVSLLKGKSHPQIVIISDGKFPPLASDATGGIPIELVTVGQSGDNVAITAVDARSDFSGRKEKQLFVVVHNYGANEAKVELDVAHNGTMLETRRLTLKAGGEESALFKDLGAREGRLVISLNNQDVFPADNVAYCVLQPETKTRVTLVTTANPFLAHALKQDPNVELELVAPASYHPRETADLTVFDGAAPPAPSDLPKGAYWFVNCLPAWAGFERSGTDSTPEIYDWNADAFFLRFVQLDDVLLAESLLVKLPKECEILAESRRAPLLALYSSAGRDCLLQMFDFYNSNMPFRAAFPVFASNVLSWANKRKAGGGKVTFRAGDLIDVAAPLEASNLTMIGPDDKGWRLERNPNGRIAFDKTFSTGYYRTEAGGKKIAEYGVSLLNAAESDIAPQPSFSIGGVTKAAATGVQVHRSNREIWPWFALAALGLLMVEWIIYHRRIWV